MQPADFPIWQDLLIVTILAVDKRSKLCSILLGRERSLGVSELKRMLKSITFHDELEKLRWVDAGRIRDGTIHGLLRNADLFGLEWSWSTHGVYRRLR